MTALLWLTRDLRLHNHPALTAALEAHERVIPVFCLDDRLLAGRHASGPRTQQFMLECLRELGDALRERGGGLVVRRAPPERALPALALETGAHEVYCTADSGPFARERAKRVRQRLERAAACETGLHAVTT
jgi:deoxyribodipyrimidine photo-lyase